MIAAVIASFTARYADKPVLARLNWRAAMKTSRIARAWRLSRLALHLCLGILEVAVCFPRRSAEARARAIQRWSIRLCRILAIRVNASGDNLGLTPPPNTVLVANHVSWLDIFVMNAVTVSRFVAKAEVRTWPVIGWLCVQTGTLFVTREKRHDTRRINQQIAGALSEGDCIAVFPEGSTTAGFDVISFNASLLQPAIDAGATLQPVALRYFDRQGERTDAAAYIGEMSLADSMRRLLAEPAITVQLDFLDPMLCTTVHRRDLAKAAHAAIAAIVRVGGVSADDHSPAEDAEDLA